MDRKLNRTKYFKFHLLYISFVFSLVYIFGLGINLELNFLVQMLLVSLVSSLVKFFLLNPLILFLILTTSILAGLLVNHYLTPFLLPFIEKINSLFYNIIQNLQGRENITLDNLLIFWGLLIIIVSIFTAFIIFKNKSIYWLLPIYSGFFLYYWYTFFDPAYWMFALFLLTLLFFIGLDKNPDERTDKIWSKTVIFYSTLIVLSSILLPKTNKFIESPWLRQKAYSLFPMIGELRYADDYYNDQHQPSMFNFSITGFQNAPSKLGGPVLLNNKMIMSIESNKPHYLRGNVRHIYTGNYWNSANEPWKSYSTEEDFSILSEEDRNLYYEKSKLKITNHSFSSTTLFSPYMPSKIKVTGDSPIIKNPDDALVFNYGIYDGESYEVQVETPIPYGVLVSLGIDRKKEELEPFDIYLQIPDEKITNRTRSLVKEIVKDADNDFEKALAIETYLRNNYEYSLKVSTVPEDQEFIDYFLFEEEKGYCTYYATTMALMLRMEGIPSRYIEGYLANELVGVELYQVKQSNAHAWVEGFIEPVGWMTFEATPTFPVEPRLENYEPVVEEIGTSPEDNNRDNQIPDKIIDDPIRYNEEDFLDGEIGNYKTQPEEATLVKYEITIEDVLLFLLFIVIIRFLISFLKYQYKKRKIKVLPNDMKVLHLYKDILSISALLGYPQESGETHFEYANRIAYRFSRFQGKGIVEVTEIFVKSKYSHNPTLDEDILDLEIYRKSLNINLKNKLGNINYFYQKYIKIKW